MSLSVNTSVANSPALYWLVGTKSTYALETRSVLRVNQLGMENVIRSTVEVQVLDKLLTTGEYVVRVTVLDTVQSQQQGLHQLLTALNQVSDVLEIAVNLRGYAQRVLNRPVLLTKWPGVRAALSRRFRQFPQTQAVLSGLDQQLVVPGALESAILPNGIYGVLFAGLLGQSFSLHTPEPPELRVLPRFFGTIDLPLLVRKQAALLQGVPGNGVRVEATGALDEANFDAASWRHLLRQITDTPTLDTAIMLVSHDTYELNVLDGTLRSASQELRIEVPGVYRNELTHRLTIQPPQS